ncbi:hypothetical protein [Ochrovirga pacifica]|uniref:hypothetical protein n=1 Tax=Ochrovirga pacifica TaxID=1042376 RepID=UPI00025591B5|nr:hypothetical protein [Ochrovirga pacifica]
MSHQYETGNAINVANFQKLIQQISTYPEYNPSVNNLQLTNLDTLYTKANNCINQTIQSKTDNKNAIHQRRLNFQNLKKLCTRISNYLGILELSNGALDQAKSINRSIQGNKRKRQTTPQNTTKTISTSRQSFTQLTENFTRLIEFVSTIPSYNPNTEDLKIASLNNYKQTLINSTITVDQTEAILNIKLIERNNVLYAPKTGLYTIAQNVKKYIKSLYGPTSEEYTKIARIKFRNNS